MLRRLPLPHLPTSRFSRHFRFAGLRAGGVSGPIVVSWAGPAALWCADELTSRYSLRTAPRSRRAPARSAAHLAGVDWVRRTSWARGQTRCLVLRHPARLWPSPAGASYDLPPRALFSPTWGWPSRVSSNAYFSADRHNIPRGHSHLAWPPRRPDPPAHPPCVSTPRASGNRSRERSRWALHPRPGAARGEAEDLLNTSARSRRHGRHRDAALAVSCWPDRIVAARARGEKTLPVPLMNTAAAGSKETARSSAGPDRPCLSLLLASIQPRCTRAARAARRSGAEIEAFRSRHVGAMSRSGYPAPRKRCAGCPVCSAGRVRRPLV